MFLRAEAWNENVVGRKEGIVEVFCDLQWKSASGMVKGKENTMISTYAAHAQLSTLLFMMSQEGVGYAKEQNSQFQKKAVSSCSG